MSAVQFNLLPDIKLQYVKSQQTRNRVISLSILVSGVALGIFLLLLIFTVIIQKKQLSDADKQIVATTAEIKSIDGIEKALTVQNQLTTLSGLHQNKHVSSRIFGYLSQLTPPNVSLGRLSMDFSTNTLVLEGTANSQSTVNTFIDTLKFTKYQIGSTDSFHQAFPSVVESSFSVIPPKVSYALTVQFDPKLFSNNLLSSAGVPQEPKLQVPNQVTTRSSVDPANFPFNGQVGGQ
ncbi:MAG: PilN domain-containing protein, partial [Candidatus Saccharimonadales bacterium]